MVELQELLKNMEEAINASGKKRDDIAQELGMTYNQLWRILSGQRRVCADFVAKIAIVTGKTPNELYGNLANPTRSPAGPGEEKAV